MQTADLIQNHFGYNLQADDFSRYKLIVKRVRKGGGGEMHAAVFFMLSTMELLPEAHPQSVLFVEMQTRLIESVDLGEHEAGILEALAKIRDYHGLPQNRFDSD